MGNGGLMPLNDKLGPFLLILGAIIYLNSCVGCVSRETIRNDAYNEGYYDCMKSHWKK